MKTLVPELVKSLQNENIKKIMFVKGGFSEEEIFLEYLTDPFAPLHFM